MNRECLISNIDHYYSQKIEYYGAVPQGVDWNSEKSQIIRFEKLSQIIQLSPFSLNDIGCGYGKYLDFLKNNFQKYSYYGYDVASNMIKYARILYPDDNFMCTRCFHDWKEVDYSIASGIFNVKMEHNEAEWLSYILSTLEQINEKSIRGFSFNMLTKYSDKEYMRDDLYYADPLFIFDYCKRNFSKEVALFHDYGLYEFTILVRKDV